MERAIERLDATYGDAVRARRLAIGERRDELADVPLGAEHPALADVLRWHRDATATARRAADAEGGEGWLARAGHDDGWLDEHLWDGHVAPLVGRRWVELGQAAAR
jgi:hypothetical protein